MKIKLLVLAIAVCMVATPARADLIVVGQSFTTEMAISSNVAGTIANTVVTPWSSSSSALAVTLQDTSIGVVDGVQLLGSVAPIDLKIAMVFTGSGDTYSASGTLSIWDRVGSAITTPADILGTFTSTLVDLDTTGFLPALDVRGNLFANPILQNTSNPWVFQGDQNFTGNDADGIAKTISLYGNVGAYRRGQLIALNFPVLGNPLTVQDVFKNSTLLQNGEVTVTVVPVPAAVLLGALGLSVAGLKLRKRA